MSYLFRLFGSTNSGEVDASGQQRVIPYDAAGSSLAPLNRVAVAETIGGQLISGKDYKLARTLRIGQTGAMSVSGDETVLLIDAFEGTTRNLNQWIETAATMTSAQTLATGLQLNSGASVTTTQGILESSNRQMPLGAGSSLLGRWHQRVLGLTNCVEEWGFSDQSSATTAIHQNGAFFRRDSAGSLQPVLAFAGTETQGSVMAGFDTTHYNTYVIFLEDLRATFQVLSHTGVLLASQVMEIGATGAGAGVTTQARLFNVTHIPAFMRVVNTGAAGTAPQINVTFVTITMLDVWSQRPHYDQQSALGLNTLTSPTLYTQLANYANSAAPASATLSNTAAGYTTLGGQWQFAAVAGAETDYALFGFTNPSPYTLYITSVSIQTWLQAIAIVTTPTILQWGLAVGSSAVSLATAAPYTPMRKTIGAQSFSVGTPPGELAAGGLITYAPKVPDVVQPGKFFHLILKIPLGTATASQIIRGTAMVDGYSE